MKFLDLTSIICRRCTGKGPVIFILRLKYVSFCDLHEQMNQKQKTFVNNN